VAVNTAIVSHSYKPGSAMAVEAIPFPYLDPSNVNVVHVAATGVRTPLVPDMHYVLAGNGLFGVGTIRALGAWPAGDVLQLTRATTRLQKTVLSPGEPLPSKALEQALDRQMLIVQEQNAAIDDVTQRSMLAPIGEVAPALPSSASRISKLLGFDAIGRAVALSYQSLASSLAPFLPAILGPLYQGDPGGHVMSVGVFAAIGGMTIPIGTDLIQTSGATRGQLIADTSLTDADVAAHPLAIVKTKNGRYFRRDLANLSILHFGAVSVPPKVDGTPADAMPDCYLAFIAALAYLRRFSVGIPFFQSSATLLVPAGWYYCSQTINLAQSVAIIGEGSGLEGGQRSVIVNDPNVSGIVAHGNASSGTNTAASGSIFQGLTFYARTAGAVRSSQACGIWLRIRATIRECIAFGYAMDGFSVRASSDGNTDPIGNANLLRIENCTALSNGRAGFWVTGYDANAGTLFNPNATQNGQWGWYVAGFLQTTIIGGHSASNGEATATNFGMTNLVYNAGKVYSLVYNQEVAGKTTPPSMSVPTVWHYIRDSTGEYSTAPQWVPNGTYVSGGAAYLNNAVHLGFYTEGGQGPYYLEANALASTGTPGAGFAGPGVYEYTALGKTVSNGGHQQEASGPSGRKITVQTVNQPDAGFVRNIYDSADLSAVPFQHQEIVGGGAMRLAYNQLPILYMTGLNPTEAIGQFGTGVPQPRVCAPTTFAKFDLSGNFGRREWVGGGPPTTGRFARGDHIRNIDPAVGQPKGWFCTVGGTPGTWVADSNL
jgi:hypothetical protein